MADWMVEMVLVGGGSSGSGGGIVGGCGGWGLDFENMFRCRLQHLGNDLIWDGLKCIPES